MSDSPTGNLEAIAQQIRAALTVKHRARESAFTLSRDVIRNAANAIRAVHRGGLESARQLLTTTVGLLADIEGAIAEHPELRSTGYVHDAQKEYAEAATTLALASGTSLPSPEELGVGYSAYLNGIGEAVGEMRRYLLDALRRDQLPRCEQLLGYMDDIYNVLVTMDFPRCPDRGPPPYH